MLGTSLSAIELAGLAGVLLAGGFVRGYGGFGTSAVVITALSPFISPSKLVPVMIMLEFVASLIQARGAWPNIDWSILKVLVLGVAIGSPLGLMTHFFVSEQVVRMAILIFVLAISIALLRGWTLKRQPGTAGMVAVGTGSGVAATAASLGGLPIVLFMVAGDRQPAVIRATMVAFFLCTNLLALGLVASGGLLTSNSFLFAALGIPVMAAGMLLGGRHFLSASAESFRRFVLSLLIFLALAGLARVAGVLG